MAISIVTSPTTEDLRGKSHWWGFPDLPKGVALPCFGGEEADDEGYEDTLTFICQIRLEDIAPYDEQGLLPHKGMLYFFAALDYFMGDLDAPCEGMGRWSKGSYKVLYSPNCEELVTHEICYDDGTSAALPALKMSFERCDDREYGLKLLGVPALCELDSDSEGYMSLLQLDEDEDSGLRFFDMGMLNFHITPNYLRLRRFDRAFAFMYSL